MHRQDIGPRMFGDRLGYNRAVSVDRPDRWLVLAGHESRGPDGAIVHVRDLRGQIETTFDRIAETLGEAGFTFTDVVRLRYFALDVAAVTSHFDVITARLERENCRPATTLVGVTALSDPDMLIEIEGLAVR
ncbi:Rid family hydrolase [Embleya hyalina]|uniref:Enamine deaminase RidA n=1 Tax=Embleya hyalina TaxID=516124 RepID=A0A401Z6G4_9ACTN|nr:Rid family hydrolase [Embleya hyalina]GCE02429.1 enamine deaminase RidA [Embleya hyalina]